MDPTASNPRLSAVTVKVMSPMKIYVYWQLKPLIGDNEQEAKLWLIESSETDDDEAFVFVALLYGEKD